VTFAISGEGIVIGNSAIGADPMRAEAGIATALIQASATPGHITVQASAFGLKSATLEFESRASLKNELQWKGLPYEAH
jgi:beta-galactosidase